MWPSGRDFFYHLFGKLSLTDHSLVYRMLCSTIVQLLGPVVSIPLLDSHEVWFSSHFSRKGYINITKIPITPGLYTNKMSKDTKDTHSQKKWKKEKVPPRWSITNNSSTLTTTEDNTGITKEALQSNASKKETMHKHCRCAIEDLGFSSWRKSEFTQKQCLQ